MWLWIEREVVDSAEPLEALPSVFVPTAAAEALLAMKVLSVTPQRPQDLAIDGRAHYQPQSAIPIAR